MRVFWVAYDTLYKILSLKVLILSLAIVLAIVFASLAMSNYLTSAGPAWHDLFRKYIFQDFMGTLYFFAQMLLTPFVVIISALAAQDMYRGEAEQIYLTGGLSKPVAFTGRILGLLVYIFLLWWALFVAAGATVLCTGLGNIEPSMVGILAKLLLNSVALSFLVCSLIGLTKVVVVGITPILISHYWLTVNNDITMETAGNAVHNAVNYLLPLYTFTTRGFDSPHILMKYQDLSPWHGTFSLVAFIAFFLLASAVLYMVKQD